MAGEDDGGFKCIKITLMVLYILSLIGTTILVILAIVGLAGNPAIKPQDRNKEFQEVEKSLLVTALVMGVVLALISAMGLYGVIKENKCIMITMTVLCFLSLIAYAVQGQIITSLWAAFQTILTGLYVRKIHQRQMNDFDNNKL